MEIDYITNTDIFNRENLIGDQSINTINGFNSYLDSLLNPFNDILTQLLIDGETNININPEIKYDTNKVSLLQFKNNDLLNKYGYINNISNLTSSANTYITELTSLKTSFTTLLNDKAFPTTPLTRPTLKTVLNSNLSALNKEYITNKLLEYSLPTPIPNTKLYVNRQGNGYIWA